MNSPTIVHTQAEMDAAARSDAEWIRIDSPRGVWIDVATPSGIEVEASGSATVRAYGSATVTASGSATVRAYGSATVTAYDSATVTAYGSATVTAYDSATVRASGWATVTASGSATVTAYDSATVRASGSATVTASTHVAVHLHSGHARISGGVLIDHTAVDLDDRATWLAYKGVPVADGQATFYKAVDQDSNAGHGYRPTAYPVGGTVTAPDWNPAARCGGGLHFSPSPGEARGYYNGPGEPRYLEVLVPVDGLVFLDDKVKARSCTVVREVTEAGTLVRAAVTS